jgi:hypothetical protein
MLRAFAVATALFVLPAALAAQSNSAHGEHAAHHAPTTVKGFEGDFAAHFKGIELSDALKTRLVALRDEWHKKIDATKAAAAAKGTKADDPALVAQVEQLKAQEHAAFRALLAPAQQKVFDENMKAHDAMDSHKKKDGGR